MARPRTSAAMTTRAFLPRCRRPPPGSTPPTMVSSTSTSAETPIPAGPHHRAAELVQPRPGRAVTAQTEDALQAQGAGAVLLADHPPDRPKPERQRGTSALEDRARHHRRLVPTDRAHPESSPGGPRLGAIARGAHEAPPPTETRQVVAARLLGHEALFELLECARVLLHSPNHYRLGSLESRTYLHAPNILGVGQLSFRQLDNTGNDPCVFFTRVLHL